MNNFNKPEVINNSADDHDITKIKYFEQQNQVENYELGIGTSTRLLLYELEDEVAGTSVQLNIFSCVRAFYYETSVKKMLDKFPLDTVIKKLAFLDPRYRTKISTSALLKIG